MLKVKRLNPLATIPTIAHPGEDLGYDIYALRDKAQPINEDGTPMTYNPPAPGMPTRMNFEGQVVKPIRIESGKPTMIDTGIAVHFEGFNAAGDPGAFGLLVRDRSSLAKKGVFVTAGVVDAGYRGELKLIFNVSGGGYIDLWPGDKIAQLIPVPVLADSVEEVKELEESKRAEGGFGSSGQ